MPNQLIHINPATQSVSARELHSFLEVETQFTIWCKRMFEGDFTEGQDYEAINQKRLTAQGNETTYTDYALTLDTAKHISMMQRSERGKEARQYFITTEKRYKAIQAMPKTQVQVLAEGIMAAQAIIAERDTEIAVLKPLAEYTQQVLQAEGTYDVTVIAKELKLTAQALNSRLHELGVQFKVGNIWVLYKAHQGKGYTDTETKLVELSNGKTVTNIRTVWTEAGRAFIHQLFNHRISDSAGQLGEGKQITNIELF